MNTFTTPAAITAVLDVPAGRIQLTAADHTDTTVQVRPADPSKNRDVKAAEQTTVDFRDGVLHIQTTIKNQLMGPTGSVQVNVQLPTGSAVQATAASAQFQGHGRFGQVTFDGAHGQFTLEEATTVHLTAHAGEVEIGRLNGSADINISKGDIHITEAVSGTLALKTQAGDITIGATTSASLDAGTSYGRIHNSLKNNGSTQLHIHATTSHGDVTARSL